MRVHIYTREFPMPGTGFGAGLTKAVHGLAGGMVRNGARVTLLCNGPVPSKSVADDGYEILRFEQVRNRGLSIPRDLPDYMRTCKEPGIFLLNGAFNPAVYAISRACLKSKIPYVCWPHDPYHPELFRTRKYLKWPYWYLRERRLLGDADAIQVLSDRQEGWLRDLGVQTPTFEIANGCMSEDVLPAEKLQWSSDGPAKLLFLGRFDYYNKAIDVLLDAFAAIYRETDACLTLQGPDWGDLDAMKRRARNLGLDESRVQFKKPDFTRSAGEIMADHDAFILPSRFEGFALASLEAMCAGRVLLVSDVNGISNHVVRSGCGMVVTSNIESVKNGLRQLLSRRSEWKAMGLAGRNYALSKFKWDSIAEKVLLEYTQILTNRRTTHAVSNFDYKESNA